MPIFSETKLYQFGKINEQENFKENSNFKEEIAVDLFFNFHNHAIIKGGIKYLKISTLKFRLPISYQTLPKRPPKNY
jgi:mRNA-degrading endonuclease HigB of HigAB toxin-antitoxin module